MTKKEELTLKLKLIVNDRKKLEQFILKNSNLPGPRGNIGLAFALAEIFDQIDVLFDWLKITEEEADTNNPKAFLPFCAAVCLGKIYTKRKNKKIITVLKKSANDGRWRMREAVAFAFQIIGENNFDELKNIFSVWNNKSNNFEKRAILVSLAHPKFLNEGNAKFCFEIAEVVLKEMNRENNFDVLRKGLEFTISVFAAANPKLGFTFIKRWIGKDKVIDKIMKENLKKDRLVRKNPGEVKMILESI